jgi:hypothetical protein
MTAQLTPTLPQRTIARGAGSPPQPAQQISNQERGHRCRETIEGRQRRRSAHADERLRRLNDELSARRVRWLMDL